VRSKPRYVCQYILYIRDNARMKGTVGVCKLISVENCANIRAIDIPNDKTDAYVFQR
jgi:hypothetical protein